MSILCHWQSMTRWARGGCANRKKPLDATDWTEMKSDASTQQTASQKVKKLDSKQKSEVRLKQVQHNVADELEMLGKKSTLAGNKTESVLLEEFVRKDARREARRLKRQEQKQQNRVCSADY